MYRCPVRRAHGTYITRGKPPSGPRASAPLISSPGSRSGGPARWGVWRARLRSYAPTGTQRLGVKRESRAAACARCAARGACVRGTVAARPLCGSYSSCRRLSSTYDSWHRIYVCTKGIRSKNGGLPLMLTVILLSSIRAGPLLNHVSALVDRCSWYMRQKYVSIRCRVENSVSICYAGKPQPMPDRMLALVELILAVCRCFSRALLIGIDST